MRVKNLTSYDRELAEIAEVVKQGIIDECDVQERQQLIAADNSAKNSFGR